MSRKADPQSDDALARFSPERAAAILEARARRLARRGRADEADTAPVSAFLLCAVGANLYGLPLTAVARVRPVGPLGKAPSPHPAFLGLVVDSGRIRPVLDLAILTGGPAGSRAGGHLAVLKPPANVALRLETPPTVVQAELLDGADAGKARVAGADSLAGKIMTVLAVADLLGVARPSTTGA